MCGICGIIDLKQTIPNADRKAATERMNEALWHRGPDGEGIYHGHYASLAMRRLAIIDLAGGDQPLWNEDKTIGVFMNGEIYNFRELRADLRRQGHQFYSNSDTEVIVHLYETYGDDFVARLRGMFAFCLFDLRQSRFLLARDRFGEKPLYYHFADNVCSFSSEPTSLLAHHRIERKLDKTALDYYLAAAYIPEPLTLLQQVFSLPPGHQMIVDEHGVHTAAYFSVDYSRPALNGGLVTEVEEAKELLTPLLKQAVRRQLVSDVPVGAFLSGGIDSSTVCALAQEELSGKLATFTVKFEEASYDESKIAAEVASRIGSDHHEIVVPNAQFSESIFWDIISHVGLPFPDSSAIPVHLISQEIRKYVKVALSGDGGDEVFAGYPFFGWWQKIRQLLAVPKPIRKAGLHLAQREYLPLPAGRNRQLSRALRASLDGEKGISLGIGRMFFDEELMALRPQHQLPAYPLFTTTPPSFANWTNLRKSMHHRLKHNLPTDMLIKVDRMSMANSLEVRAPFLDPDLFEASLQISDDLLFSKGTGKKIVREIMRDQLPNSVFDHPKSGFSIPLHKYQNEAYHRLSDELLGPTGPLSGLFELSALEQINKLAFNTLTDTATTTVYRASHQHWSLLLLAGWMKKFDVACP